MADSWAPDCGSGTTPYSFRKGALKTLDYHHYAQTRTRTRPRTMQEDAAVKLDAAFRMVTGAENH